MIAWVICKIMFGLKTSGFENLPQSGATLLCANHQSNLDPIAIGCIPIRRMNFMAKKPLFSVPLLGWLIAFLDSIPVGKEGLSAGGVKETLKRLKRDEMVLIFPEGQRTGNGKMIPLLPGFCALVKRTRPTLVPIGIAGSFQAWPRTRSFPLPGPRIRLVMGLPITRQDYEHLDDDSLIKLLDIRIRECVAQAQIQAGQKPDT
jgi:1-acyl-sn-glycerol-3-phosphate acyltransferase